MSNVIDLLDNLIIQFCVGESVGHVEEIDVGDGGNCLGQFARVRVTKPLENL